MIQDTSNKRKPTNCGNCRWYDPREEYCIECDIYRRKTDGAQCDFYQEGWSRKNGREKESGI